MEKERRGLLLALSSPSGAGKTTIARELLSADSKVKVSISYTTRSPRPGEVDGKDYLFTDIDSFMNMVDEGYFLEYAKVFGNYYGTPLAPVEEALAAGYDVLFDIDWQGVQQLAQLCRNDLVSIFILPPTWNDLEKRLRTRAQDDDDVIHYRMRKARNEISHWAEYEYVIVNESLDLAVKQAESIICAERLKRNRQVWLTGFVRELDRVGSEHMRQENVQSDPS